MQHRPFQPKPGLRFIPTCHNCGALGHIRPKWHKSLVRNNEQDLTTYIRFLNNQVNNLTELMTQLTKITSSFENICTKRVNSQIKVILIVILLVSLLFASLSRLLDAYICFIHDVYIFVLAF